MNKSVVLYSTGCPQCTVLKEKLRQKSIEYTECNDVNKMIELGIEQVPVLEIDEKLLSFSEANKWINEREV